MNLVIPMYWPPDQAGWADLTTMCALRSVSDVVINPSSGPGAARQPLYTTTVTQLKRHRKSVSGYVATNYGSRSITAIKADIDKYFSWYHVDGIFLDEVDSQKVTFYNTIAKDLCGRILLNPGTGVIGPALVQDVVCTRETTQTPYLGSESTGGSNALHIVNAVSDFRAVLEKGKKQNAAYIYLTDQNEPNPYKSLPPWIRGVDRELLPT